MNTIEIRFAMEVWAFSEGPLHVSELIDRDIEPLARYAREEDIRQLNRICTRISFGASSSSEQTR